MFRQRFLSSTQVSAWTDGATLPIPSRPVKPPPPVSHYVDAVVADTPISYWQLDEPTGAFAATYGASTAVITGNPSRIVPGAVGGVGQALRFPTTGDYVTLALTGSLPRRLTVPTSLSNAGSGRRR